MLSRQFLFILFFYLGFHFILPVIAYQYWGFINLYSPYIGYSGFIANLITVLVSFVLITSWHKKHPNQDKINNNFLFEYARSFFLISLILSFYKFIIGGGYEGALQGSNHGTIVSFLSLFFRVDVAFILLMCCQQHIKRVYLWCILYVLSMTLMGSRSAVITVLLLYIYSSLFVNKLIIQKKLRTVLIILGLISPVLFFYGTSVRGVIDKETLGKLIIGRISMVELSEIPIQTKEKLIYDKEVFDNKYSFSNQMQQTLNALSPIDPFEYDISPNQYFRQIFLGVSEDRILEHYMSINMTLPTYYILKTNFILGIIISIFVLYSIFHFWIKHKNNMYIYIIIPLVTYNVLYFFDYVMIFQDVFSLLLTLICFRKYDLFLRSIKYTYQKHFLHGASIRS